MYSNNESIHPSIHRKASEILLTNRVRLVNWAVGMVRGIRAATREAIAVGSMVLYCTVLQGYHLSLWNALTTTELSFWTGAAVDDGIITPA